MTAIIQRIRRKRRLSSDLDSRWGDVAISSPNEGSWSQYDGASARTSPVSSEHGHSHRPKHNSGECTQSFHYTNGGTSESSREMSPNSFNMPTGYYDAKLRRQTKTKIRTPKAQPVQPKPITLPKAWEAKKLEDNPADEAGDDISALGSPRGRRGTTDDTNSRGSKSPPLSVTSRMRRHSGQSIGTEPMFSVPGTASSERTSFGLDDSQIVRHPPQHNDKKLPLPQSTSTSISTGTKVRDAGPNPASQELVPSYDDLYG